MRITLVLVLLGLNSMAFGQASSGAKHGAGSQPAGGRFQLIQLSDFRRDQFLIDTATGKLWRSVCSKTVTKGECDGPTMFEEVMVEGISAPQATAAPTH